jgi:hypothetical protein
MMVVVMKVVVVGAVGLVGASEQEDREETRRRYSVRQFRCFDWL